MKTILVPIDFSPQTRDALVVAASMARDEGDIVMLMHNVETLVTNWPNLSVSEKHKHQEIEIYQNGLDHKFHEILQDGIFDGLQVRRLITYGVTIDEIVRSSIQFNADLIVMCSESDSKVHDFIGSTIQKVVRHAACPVLVFKQKMSFKTTKVLVPVSLDFDIAGPFQEILKLSKQFGSTIQLLYINTPQDFKDAATINDRMNSLMSGHPTGKFESAIYDYTGIEEGILSFAESAKPDYIAMITYDHTHAASYHLSVTDYILYHATVPVVTVCEHSNGIRGLYAVNETPDSLNV